jgi:hypothetical protein
MTMSLRIASGTRFTKMSMMIPRAGPVGEGLFRYEFYSTDVHWRSVAIEIRLEFVESDAHAQHLAPEGPPDAHGILPASPGMP